MNLIQHLIEPHRLFLFWQRPIAGKERRTRHLVGEIERVADGTVFRYLKNQDDFARAREEGFQGFPAFDIKKASEYTTGALDAFMRRVPPRRRDDFIEYLARHRLPETFAGSDLALLAYTGAKLPGDGFEIVPDLAGIAPPMELVMEVAGFRHQDVPIDTIAVGEKVELVPEPNNQVDPEAVAVMCAYGRIGYIARPYRTTVNNWLSCFSVEANIDRINGKPDRPLVYLFINVS